VRPGRATDHSPPLVPRPWKSRAIPLPTLWATTGPVTGLLYLPYVRGRSNVVTCKSGQLHARVWVTITSTLFPLHTGFMSVRQAMRGCDVRCF
jgi:hypothetical protein